MKLYQSQLQAVDGIIEKRKCLLPLPMGSGKTAITLSAAQKAYDLFIVDRILVIAPLRVAHNVWPAEAKKWKIDLKISKCLGTAQERTAGVRRDAQLYIINRENVSWLINNHPWKWDMVIIDESTSFKSHSTQRFKSIKTVLDKIKMMVLMSGIPAPNTLLELWSQIYCLDKGVRLSKYITHFRRRYFDTVQMGEHQFSYEPKSFAYKKITEKISDLVVDVNVTQDLPDKVEINSYLRLSKESQKLYDKFHNDFIIKLNDIKIKAPTVGVLTGKLLQFADGALYKEQEQGKAREWQHVHKEKLTALQELVDDNPSEQLIVVYRYRFDIERIQKAFPHAKVLSTGAKEVDEWNDGKIKMLLIHPQSAGYGLNMQFGGSFIVWYGLPWSYDQYDQTNARLYRQGQNNKVRIVRLIVKDTMDTHVRDILKGRVEGSNKLLSYLREHCKRR